MCDLGLLTWGPVAGMAALLAVFVVAPSWTTAAAGLIAAVGAAVGIPHGAVDHLIPWWWASRGTDRPDPSDEPSLTSRMLLFGTAYAAVAAGALAAFLVVPTPTLLVFLLLATVHFGRGDVVASAERAGRPITSAATDWVVATSHGLVVVGLLLWASPASIDPLLRPLSPWLADAASLSRSTGLLVVAGSVVLALGILLRGHRHLEAAELVLLAAVFSLAPPLAAFGVYFGGWHAVRHTGRLLDLARDRAGGRAVQVYDVLGHADVLDHADGRQSRHDRPTGGDWWAATALLVRASAGPSLVALAAVAGLWAMRDLASLQAQVAVLLALTFPHSVVVWQMDRRQARDADCMGDQSCAVAGAGPS